MSRATSLEFKQKINGDSSDDPFLMMVKITHSSFAQDIRIVNNGEDITSNGDLYKASGFELFIPSETTENISRLKITILNVDASLTAMIRALDTAPEFTAFLVYASDPDTIEVGEYILELHDVTINKSFIEGSLIVTPINNDDYPSDFMDSTIFTNLT